MKRIGVLVVEASSAAGEALRRIVDADPRLEAVGVASEPGQALRLLEIASPAVVSVSLSLAGGIDLIQTIMATCPTPVVALDSDARPASKAPLKAGAVAVVETGGWRGYRRLDRRLCQTYANMSQVKVVKRRFDRAAPARRAPAGGYRLLGIAASTGGPGALIGLLNGLGADFALPVALVQHMTVNSLEGFARWLGEVAPFEPCVVQGGEEPRRGRLYLAPADRHLVVGRERMLLGDGEPVCRQRPSATVLFESMARQVGPAAVGVQLTGMGEDGARGLLAMRLAGAYTIAEDESTAVVYGMPKAAMGLGAVRESCPLHRIAPRILALLAA